MIRALLIDDEHHSNHTLRYELERHCPNVQVLGEALSGEEGIFKIEQLKPDLIFLDIEMPGMSGFEMISRLVPVDFEIIFVTAYDQYAIRAFRFAAVDYLLKPVTGEYLKEAVGRISRRDANAEQHLKLEAFMHNMRHGMQSPRIALSSGRGMDFVNVTDILYCHAESNYTHMHMSDGKKYTQAKTLKDVEQILEQLDFFRIHQSYLINLRQVLRYVRDDGGYVIMPDGIKIPIAKRRKEEFLAWLKTV